MVPTNELCAYHKVFVCIYSSQTSTIHVPVLASFKFYLQTFKDQFQLNKLGSFLMIEGLNKIYLIILASIVVVHILIGFNMFVSFYFNILVSVIFGDTPFSCRMPEFAIDIAQISCDNLIIMKVNTFSLIVIFLTQLFDNSG